jgi:hypothetical protein
MNWERSIHIQERTKRRLRQIVVVLSNADGRGALTSEIARGIWYGSRDGCKCYWCSTLYWNPLWKHEKGMEGFETAPQHYGHEGDPTHVRSWLKILERHGAVEWQRTGPHGNSPIRWWLAGRRRPDPVEEACPHLDSIWSGLLRGKRAAATYWNMDAARLVPPVVADCRCDDT